MTRREARAAFRTATGCSMADAVRYIPEPGASREVLAGMALQGILASGASGPKGIKIDAAIDFADMLIDALSEGL